MVKKDEEKRIEIRLLFDSVNDLNVAGYFNFLSKGEVVV